MRTRILGPIVLLFVLLLVAACTAGPNPAKDTPNEEGEVAGFWQGLWHGIIAPITFIISLFNDSVRMYEVHSNGGWYDFGFLLGAGIPLGAGSGGACAGRKRR